LAERDTILRELAQLSPLEEQDKSLDKLAEFLANVADAWNEATQEQRNKIARCLFQEVWIEGKEIVAVRPQPEMKPFFELNFEAMKERLSRNFGKKRPRWGSGRPDTKPLCGMLETDSKCSMAFADCRTGVYLTRDL